MDQLIVQAAVSLLSAIGVGVVTALVTVRLALSRFYQERWWEAKMRAYTEIFSSIYHIRRSVEVRLRAEELRQEISDNQFIDLDNSRKDALAELRRQTMMASFLLSRESADVLHEFLSRLDNVSGRNSYYEYLDEELVVIVDCNLKLQTSAHADLSIRSR